MEDTLNSTEFRVQIANSKETQISSLSNSNSCIGTVKGPGETPNEFTFIAPDPERRVKHGEFVYYHTQVDGEARQILGRVTARESVKLFPDSFMADPTRTAQPDRQSAWL